MAGPYFVRPDGNNANAGTADSAAGAWKTAKFGMQFASNAVIANGDTLYIAGDQGTYTENNITWDRTIHILGLRGRPAIDGTGGAGGSNIINCGSIPCSVTDVIIQNAVAAGLNQGGGNGPQLHRVSILNCGTQGITWTQATMVGCTIRGNGATGIGTGSVSMSMVDTEVSDNVSHGINSYSNGLFVHCVIKHNGGDGIHSVNATAISVVIAGCTIDGNTSDGVEFGTSATAFSNGSIFLNNTVTNNGAYPGCGQERLRRRQDGQRQGRRGRWDGGQDRDPRRVPRLGHGQALDGVEAGGGAGPRSAGRQQGGGHRRGHWKHDDLGDRGGGDRRSAEARSGEERSGGPQPEAATDQPLGPRGPPTRTPLALGPWDSPRPPPCG